VREIASQLLRKPYAELAQADTESLFEILTSKHSGRPCVLIIDNAETLANSAQEYLRLVSRVAVDARPQLVLIGRLSPADEGPETLPLMDAVAAHWELDRLSTDQSRRFLRQLLVTEEAPTATAFEDDALDALVRHGKGLYGRMVSLLSIIRLRAIAEAVRDPGRKVRLTAKTVEEAARLLEPDGTVGATPDTDPAAPSLRTRAATDSIATPRARPGMPPARASMRPRYAYALASVALLLAAGAVSYGVVTGDAPRAESVASQAADYVTAMAGGIPRLSKHLWSAAAAETGLTAPSGATNKTAADLDTGPQAVAVAANPDDAPVPPSPAAETALAAQAPVAPPHESLPNDLPPAATPARLSSAAAPADVSPAAAPADTSPASAPAESIASIPPAHEVALAVPAPATPAEVPSQPQQQQPEPALNKVAETVPVSPPQAVAPTPDPTRQHVVPAVAETPPPAPKTDTVTAMAVPATTVPATTVPATTVPAMPTPAKPGTPTVPGAAAPAAAAQPASGDLALLLARGEAMLQIGDVLAARLFFEQAAEQGSSGAALAAGMTYDPSYLRSMQVTGISADPAMAAQWYRSAAAMGDKTGDRLAAAVAGSGH